jgi:hypothetical protein
MKTIKICSDNKNLNTIEDEYVFYCPFTGVNLLNPESAENLFLDKIANKNMMAYILEEEVEEPIYANELIKEMFAEFQKTYVEDEDEENNYMCLFLNYLYEKFKDNDNIICIELIVETGIMPFPYSCISVIYSL